MAAAAALSVVQVARIVEPGEIDPEVVITPGIFVDRIVAVPAAKQEEALMRDRIAYA
jgi:3-oxoadipate CoA-transferase alpha subunit